MIEALTTHQNQIVYDAQFEIGVYYQDVAEHYPYIVETPYEVIGFDNLFAALAEYDEWLQMAIYESQRESINWLVYVTEK